MTGDSRYSVGFYYFIKWLLIIVIISFIALVSYFIFTPVPVAMLEDMNKEFLCMGSICEFNRRWFILSARLTSLKEPLNSRYIIIGIAWGIALFVTVWRTYIADQHNKSLNKQVKSQIEQTASQIKQTESYVRQVASQVKQTEIAADRRLSERFDNAIELLSKELDENSYSAHLWAISGLRNLAIDSSENTQTCLDIICSCNQWMEEYIDEFIEAGGRTPYSALLLNEDNRIAKKDNKNKVRKITLLQERRSQEALTAVSYILAKISTHNPEQLKELKFHNKMLCGISLNNLTLGSIDFSNAYLVAANLDKISLKQARLNRTNLQGASLSVVDLGEASLGYANLQRASLVATNLEGALLDNANFKEVFSFGVSLFGASLNFVNFQGTSLAKANLQGASLVKANLQGASLLDTNLEGALLIDTQLQGASLNIVKLSHALLLDCNLYGVTLEDIKSENNIFNDIVKIGYVKSEEEKKKYLDDICQHLKPQNATSFTEQMEVAWNAMENNEEPDGLDMIRANSIVNKDNQGMYDISENNLVNLQEGWQTIINDKDKKFLNNIENSILLLGVFPRVNLYQTGDKSVHLINKLKILAKKLIESNKNTKE